MTGFEWSPLFYGSGFTKSLGEGSSDKQFEEETCTKECLIGVSLQEGCE